MPIRGLRKTKKRILFEMADGSRFYIIGGQDKRPLPDGVACFSPDEMIGILESDVSHEEMKTVIGVKATFPGSRLAEIDLGNKGENLLQKAVREAKKRVSIMNET